MSLTHSFAAKLTTADNLAQPFDLNAPPSDAFDFFAATFEDIVAYSFRGGFFSRKNFIATLETWKEELDFVLSLPEDQVNLYKASFAQEFLPVTKEIERTSSLLRGAIPELEGLLSELNNRLKLAAP